MEVTKTAAKHRTISAWTSAVKRPDRDNNNQRSGGLEAMHARQDRATLLLMEKV